MSTPRNTRAPLEHTHALGITTSSRLGALLTKKRARALSKMKRDAGGGVSIHELESRLLSYRTKTMDPAYFFAYLKEKFVIFGKQLCDFYRRRVHRRWRFDSKRRRAANNDDVVKQIRTRFADTYVDSNNQPRAKPIVIAYGDWDAKFMRGNPPSRGIGLRRYINRHFVTITTPEYRTSRRCYGCTDLLQEDAYRQKRCINTNCPRFKQNQATVHRDKNAALNIRKVFVNRVTNTQPAVFRRGDSD